MREMATFKSPELNAAKSGIIASMRMCPHDPKEGAMAMAIWLSEPAQWELMDVLDDRNHVFWEEFTNSKYNYADQASPSFKTHKLIVNLLNKINGIHLVIIIAAGLVASQIKDPYWSVETTEDRCELDYDGWSWNLEAYSTSLGSDLYHGLKLTRNPFSPYTWSVPRFNGSPTEVTVAFKKFWLTQGFEGVVLAQNEDDEYGANNTWHNTRNFLKALELLPTIDVRYVNYDERRIENAKIEFEKDASDDAIKKFFNCAAKF